MNIDPLTCRHPRRWVCWLDWLTLDTVRPVCDLHDAILTAEQHHVQDEPVEFTNGRNVVCLECWRALYPDFLHLDCTGEHFVPKAEADELREWLNGRYAWMVATRQQRWPGYDDATGIRAVLARIGRLSKPPLA